jgi:ribosomal protein S18 acetylase RimI-like enzyme
MTKASQVTFMPLQSEHAFQVAHLHKEGIPTGFLSSLGEDFLADLYQAISQSSDGFGFVVRDNDKIVGFVAFCSNLRKLYKQVYRIKGLKLLLVLIPKLFSVRTIRKIYENIFYPKKTESLNLPDAELLSIVVSLDCRGKGFARKLIETGLQECCRRGIPKLKVLVADFNQSANCLYQQTGFQLATKIENHGVVSNVYVVPTDYFEKKQSL